MGMSFSAPARCGRCRPITARRRAIVLEDPSCAPTGLSSSRRCATASMRSASGSPRRPAPGLHRRPVRHVLDAAADPEQVLELREATPSTWPTAAASTWSAWPTTPSIALSPPWSRTWMADGDRDPGKRGVGSTGARSRAWSSPAARWTGSRKRSWSRRRRCSTSSARAATTWRRSARHPAQGRRRRPAAIIGRGRCCWRWACRWPTRWDRAWARPAAIRTAAISASSSTSPIPSGAHALPMCGGVGAQYTPAAGWAQAILYQRKVLERRDRRRDRRGPGRRRVGARPAASGRR